ncbi:MAG: serine/threonine protein kinase [Planctomycetes bacterium]|nr:serine/threonine protein kinase [Planctomycetota bacterium]
MSNPTENFGGKSPALPGMSIPGTPGPGATQDEVRLFELAQEYLRELEAGHCPDRHQWLERSPDLASMLGPCLEGLDLVHQATSPKSSLGSDGARLGGPSADASSASPLGDFQIVREIGRGGMGIVYEAVQLSLGRRVALKVLPFAATFDAKQLQRFRQEAQAAAQLHHASIVPVHGVGCERGVHFYAMQLIDGQSLDTVIRQLRQEAGLGPIDVDTDESAVRPQAKPTNSSTTDSTTVWTSPSDNPADRNPDASWTPAESTRRQVSACFSTHQTGKLPERFKAIARSMAQAAEALEYAHQQGVIHRDIKPANLLFDFRDNIWITDFGLAHFHNAPGLTRTGDIVGTIRYMSPEQASGQRVLMDHRTDIYSLGATFYELLTLQPVFSGTTRQALLADVLSHDPKPPRSLDHRIPAELETILLKAISKNSLDRYASAQELADDLHRFLRDEPIRAKRPTLVDHARKWSRRHPSVLVASVLVLVATLAGSLIANWFITQANERTKAALAEASLRADEAEQRFQQARKAADLLVDVSEQELANRPASHGLRKRLLETAISYYKDFSAQRHGNPATQAELVAVRERLKKSLDDLTVLEGAGQFILLSDSRVQADLVVTDNQRQAIESLNEQFAQRRLDFLHDGSQQSPDERRARFVELARANDLGMRKLLTALQLERLEQITLQLQGPMAFEQTEIATQLKLSEAQRQAIRQIKMETFAKHWDPTHRKGPPTPGSISAATMQEVMGQILAQLTPAQLETWNALRGPAFRDVADFMPPMAPRAP